MKILTTDLIAAINNQDHENQNIMIGIDHVPENEKITTKDILDTR